MNIGITTLAHKLGWSNISPRDREYEKGHSFTIYDVSESKYYVEPFLSVINGSADGCPSIVLISCSGAVGKSAMSRYLSAKFNMPVFDLAIHKAVGDSTMTGILANKYENLSFVKEELKTGRETIIVDALDEGLLKVSTDGYFAFLDDIIAITKECGLDSTPFVMTGRPRVAFETAQYLEANGINCLWLQIEPFTITQAENFIDMRVIEKQGLTYSEPYKEAKKLIIESIECFFRRQQDSDKKNYVNFLGYAPVLIAIADMFGSTPNISAIINRLSSHGYKNIQLLVDIVESILDRDRDKKVFPELVEGLIAGRDENFKKLVRERVYSYEEQCARVLSIALNVDWDIQPVDDPAFLAKYSEQIYTFANEHPFLEDGKIQNVVFESFVLAVLSTSEEYSLLAEEYMNRQMFKNSFALFPIFASLNGKADDLKPVPASLAGELAESFNSIASGNIKSEVIIEDAGLVSDTERRIDAEFRYYDANDDTKGREFNLVFKMDSDSPFNLCYGFKSTTISGDFDVLASGDRVVLQAPVVIDCDRFILACGELQVLGCCDDYVAITADDVRIDAKGNTYPSILQLGSTIQFHTDCNPPYPVNDYVKKGECEVAKPYSKDFFHKVRRLLLSFRCDSKGQGNWAKHKGKLDNRFRNGLGKKVLEIMKARGIIYEDNILYHIDVPKLEAQLGVKYDNLSSCRPSEKMVDFMDEVYPVES